MPLFSARNVLLLVVFAGPLLLSALVQRTSIPLLCEPAKQQQDKVVLITGASSGIGRQLALDYCAENATSVIILARRGDLLADTADKCRQLGARKVVAISGDVSKETSRVQTIIAEEFAGRLDVAVLNHAVVPSSLILEEPDYASHLSEVMETNTLSTVRLSQAVLPFLETSGGNLVGIGSAGQFIPQLFLSAYSISKAALQAYFDHLRVERVLLRSKVHIQYIILGEVATEMILSKHGNQPRWYSPWIVSPKFASWNIRCVVNKKLSYSFVPFFTYTFAVIGEPLRPFWALVTEYVWVNPKDELRGRLDRARKIYSELLNAA